MAKKVIPYIILSLFCFYNAESQEVVTGVPFYHILLSKEQIPYKGSKGIDTLELPFFDDFSMNSILPDPARWSDDYAYLNNTYSNRQKTTGIATLDALDNKGRLYETASSVVFKADQLTSQPVNLAYPAQDNIWISFFVQPGGLGDIPEESDSLTLSFYAPAEKKWYSVWSMTGKEQKYFKAVIINISEPRYLKKGFRFRFTNYASLSPNLNDPAMLGNCDQWNLDYILIDKNRNQADTTFNDVAFRYPMRSLLKTHEAMPWKQFNQIYLQEMGSTLPIHYRNNDDIVRNVTRFFEIWDVDRDQLSFSFTAGAANISPLSDVDYNASLVYTFNSPAKDSALFRIKSWLKTDDFDPKANDTVTYYQDFSNYFAFDDGTAEAGYGINGLGSRNAMVAIRFRSYTQDTLRAIRICFNDSYLNSNQRYFDLMVWDNDNGLPGNILDTREEVMVEQGEAQNGFHTYILPNPITVNSYFFVGWKQRSETFLNAGLDMNTLPAGKQFYWLNGNWSQSQVAGTLMIRPVLGSPLSLGTNDVVVKGSGTLRFWPNPAKDFITVDHGDIAGGRLCEVSVTDLQGRELIRETLGERISIASLKEGLYIIRLISGGKELGYNRLVKIK